MFYTKRWLNHIVIIFILAAMGILSVVPYVNAGGGIFFGNGVPAGSIIENDAFINGDQIVIDGNVDGDLFAAGSYITINGDVTGSVFVVADGVTLNGDVDGSVYAASMSFTALSDSNIAHSLYYIGANLVAESNSGVGRDLSALAFGAELSGKVGRDLNATIGIVKIVQKILEGFNWQTGKLRSNFISVNSTAPQTVFQAQFPLSAEQLLVSRVPFGQTNAANADNLTRESETPAQSNAALDWFLEQLRQFVMFFIVGGLLLWTIPNKFLGWTDTARQKPLAAGAAGFVVYIAGFFGILLLMAMVAALGFFFHTIYMGELGWTTWWVGFTGLSFAMAIYLALVNYVSKTIVAYVLGRLILSRFAPRLTNWRFALLAFGLIIYVLLRAIPVLGWIISLLAAFVGLGAMWRALQSQSESQPGAALQTVNEEQS